MLKRFFSRPTPVDAPSTEGALIYAVGDIHGRLDRLDRLLEMILDDLQAARAEGPADAPPDAMLVFLGDYVDRGPDSRGVIERIIALSALGGAVIGGGGGGGLSVRALKGNHEAQMLLFLEDAAAGQDWAEFGGAATLASYGVQPPAGRTDPQAWEAARLALAEAVPPAHLAFLKGLELMVVRGGYVFVHAGLRPGASLQAQDEQDMLWIRADFLNDTRPFEKMVVHGHTPTAAPVMDGRRIGVDTGAYATGVLTAVRLKDQDRRFIQTSR